MVLGVSTLVDGLQDEYLGIVHSPAGPVGKVQWIHKRLSRLFDRVFNNSFICLNHQRGQGYWPQIIQCFSGTLLWDGDDCRIFPLPRHSAAVHGGQEQLLEHLPQLLSTVLRPQMLSSPVAVLTFALLRALTTSSLLKVRVVSPGWSEEMMFFSSVLLSFSNPEKDELRSLSTDFVLQP